MPGFEKTLEILEFTKVVDFISAKCVSETGKARIKNSYPMQEQEALKKILEQISEMRLVYLVEGGLPLWEFIDVRLLLNKIEPAHSHLESGEFLQLQNFMEIGTEIKNFLQKHNEKYPRLNALSAALQPLHKLFNQIRFTIEPSGRVFDNASPQLKTMRKEMRALDEEIHQRLMRIKRKNAEHIQDDFLTLSDGRLVLPVREFSVRKVPGIVHGQSGSGATYYVEPMSVVELNNQMQQLRAEERKEILRILTHLTQMVKEEQEALLVNLNVLTELDVLQAKARYANEFKCHAPEINNAFEWHLLQAYHPLLLKMHPQTTVPLSLEIGNEYQLLAISGPNAGGKTVALKTVGLLQLLFQSGFHIPVGEGTRLPLCQRIFAAIGDEQSIENDLSTFSSHINSLREILENVQPASLVLIDEIGSGTEPGGGAALAIAVMEALNRPQVVTLVSTHQNQIKVFASQTPGIENGAMQFDMNTLQPLFTLEVGIPGSSYTFEICQRLGLDETIIRRAVEIAGESSFKMDQLITDVMNKSQYYRQKADELSIKESQLNSLIRLYEQKAKEIEIKDKQFQKEARSQAKELLRDVNRRVEAVIREIRESQAERPVIKKAKEQLQSLKEEFSDAAEPAASTAIDLQAVRKGQRVKALAYGITGVVSKVFKGKNQVEIEREGLKITVSADDIELLDEHGQPQTGGPSANISPAANIPNELNLRGLTVDEALAELTRYMDQALLSDWQEVRIIHGKGTGTLRQAIHDFLRRQKRIAGFRLGGWGEGDSGVTIVRLKE